MKYVRRCPKDDALCPELAPRVELLPSTGSALAFRAGVKRVAETVADEVESERGGQ